MKNICMPTDNENGLKSTICQHFGKSPFITVLKIENNNIIDIEVHETGSRHSGGHLTVAEIIMDKDGDIVICGKLGAKAVEVLGNNGTKVYSGANGTVEDLFHQWLNGEIQDGSVETCTEGHH